MFTLFLLSSFEKKLDSSFEQTYIPFTQRRFVHVWLKLALWFLRGRVLNVIKVSSVSLCRYYLHFEKGASFYLNKLEFPHPSIFIFDWNWPMQRIVNNLWVQRRQRQAINKCSLEPSAQVSKHLRPFGTSNQELRNQMPLGEMQM